MKNGVPFNVAFSVSELMAHEKHAMSIVFSEFEGGVFDFNTWKWEKKE